MSGTDLSLIPASGTEGGGLHAPRGGVPGGRVWSRGVGVGVPSCRVQRKADSFPKTFKGKHQQSTDSGSGSAGSTRINNIPSVIHTIETRKQHALY